MPEHPPDIPPPPVAAGRDWPALDPLVAGRITALLESRQLGRPLEVHRRLTSTFDRLRQLEVEGATAGTAVLAEEQTAGRGRQQRPWQSAPALGLWMSLLIETAGLEPGLLTLSTAVAVQRAILAAAGPTVSVKWPNDLQLGGRKVCGILFETAPGRLGALGIGVNVHHRAEDFPAALIGRATSLEADGSRRIERNVLAARLFESIEAAQVELRTGGGQRLLDAWRRSCNHLGRRVRVVVAPGTECSGVAVDIDAAGALVLRLDSGEQRIVLAGSLEVLEGPAAEPSGDRPA